MPETFASPEVLEFYRALPFNYYGAPEDQARAIRQQDAIAPYPVLRPLLTPEASVLDVGCGTGWLSCSIAQRHGSRVTGIDFNPVAIARAREVAAALGVAAEFEVADLFLYRPSAPVDLALSIGVLHHTESCLDGIATVCRDFVRPGGHAFIGLYHLYGRQPFLDHFAAMKDRDAGEAAMLAEFRRLDPIHADDVHALSWFRDQVIHPQETQHSLREIVPVLHECGMRLVATSINDFQPIGQLNALFEAEKHFAERGEAQLRAGRYYPGFFVFLARKAV
jgi:SAM-dependent methyltransferase